MKKIILLAAISAATLAVPAAVQAQAAPSILIVDTDTIMQTCTACRAAAVQLQSQQNAIETRRNSLASQFNTEAKSIDAEGKALGGKAPGPALKALLKRGWIEDAVKVDGPASASPMDPVSVSSTELNPAQLVRMGVRVEPGWSGNVEADVLVGQDGLAQAVRLSNDDEISGAASQGY